MKTLILLDGGNAGGLLTSDTNVHSLPAFDTAILRLLHSAGGKCEVMTYCPTGR